MEKIQNDTWHKLLGFDPGKEMKAKILNEAEAEKKPLAEICGRYAMPPICLEDEPAEGYDNPYRPAIRITTHKKESK